jgi:hypothetical protein
MDEFKELFSKSGSMKVRVKFKDSSGFVSDSAMNPTEILKTISSEVNGFKRILTFDGWVFEVYKYEIDPINNIFTILTRPEKITDRKNSSLE